MLVFCFYLVDVDTCIFIEVCFTCFFLGAETEFSVVVDELGEFKNVKSKRMFSFVVRCWLE